jgi:hypothetical protein
LPKPAIKMWIDFGQFDRGLQVLIPYLRQVFKELDIPKPIPAGKNI